MEFNYNLYPGRTRNIINFEKDNTKPKITIVTAYYNGHKYIDETINSVLNQTFPYWEWIIVNDGSTDKESLDKLKEIQQIDERIRVINKENGGPGESRDFGSRKSSVESKYLVFLDTDDLIEKTYLESLYISLETNKDAAWAYTDTVNFGNSEFLWQKYFDIGTEKKDNLLVLTAMIRKEAFWSVNGFDTNQMDFFEDWNLWLKLLSNKLYPIRVNQLGFWYRKKDISESKLSKDLLNKKEIMKKLEEVVKKIPKEVNAIQYPKQDYNWDIIQDLNIEQPLREKDGKKHILLIIPWMALGGADKFNLDLIKGLSNKNDEFTIITTEPNINVWRQEFEKVGTVYDLTTFLDRKYWPSFINYIIKKDNIDIIMNSNSTFGYSVLPYIKACNVQIPIIDYVHMEEWYNRNGGFSRDTANLENILEKTLVCNENSKKVLIDYFGRKKEKIETVYIGVDSNKFDPNKFNREDIFRKYGIKTDKKIIGFIARIDLQKRPYLLAQIIKGLKEKRKDDFLVLVAGDGPLLQELRKISKKYGIDKNIKFLGAVSNTAEIYSMCDITLNCSIKEGLALTAYESLSMGVPVVSADVGGQAELINANVGEIVPCLQKESEILNYDYSNKEISNYVEAINKVFEKLDFYKSNARKTILDQFTTEKMIEKMDGIINDVIDTKKSYDENIIKYKNIFKEQITSNYIIFAKEYDWLCKELNKSLFGEYNYEISEKLNENNKLGNIKQKIIKATVKLHIYKESKIIYKILLTIILSIRNICILLIELLKQIIKRFLNLIKMREGK